MGAVLDVDDLRGIRHNDLVAFFNYLARWSNVHAQKLEQNCRKIGLMMDYNSGSGPAVSDKDLVQKLCDKYGNNGLPVRQWFQQRLGNKKVSQQPTLLSANQDATTAVIEGTSDPFLDMTNHQAKAEHGDGDGNTPPSVASFIAAKPAAPAPAEVPDLLDMGDLLTSFDAPENMNAYPLQQQQQQQQQQPSQQHQRGMMMPMQQGMMGMVMPQQPMMPMQPQKPMQLMSRIQQQQQQRGAMPMQQQPMMGMHQAPGMLFGF